MTSQRASDTPLSPGLDPANLGVNGGVGMDCWHSWGSEHCLRGLHSHRRPVLSIAETLNMELF